MVTEKKATGRKIAVPKWLDHGLIVYCPEGESPQYVRVGLSEDAFHDLVLDLSAVSRREDKALRERQFEMAFANGVKAERVRDTDRAETE